MSDSEDNTAAIAENTAAIEENIIDILDNTARINVLDELRGRNYMQLGIALIAIANNQDVFLFNNGGSIRIKDDPRPYDGIGYIRMRRGPTDLTIRTDGQFEFRNTESIPRSGNYDINLYNGNDEGAFILSNHDSNITIVEEGDIQLNSNDGIYINNDNAYISIYRSGSMELNTRSSISLLSGNASLSVENNGDIQLNSNRDASLTADNQIQLEVGQNSVTIEDGLLTIRDETGSATLTAEDINRLKETLA